MERQSYKWIGIPVLITPVPSGLLFFPYSSVGKFSQMVPACLAFNTFSLVCAKQHGRDRKNNWNRLKLFSSLFGKFYSREKKFHGEVGLLGIT